MLKHETIVYFSRRKKIFALALFMPFLLFGIFLIFRSNEKWLGFFYLLFFGLFVTTNLMDLFNKNPQLILSKEGIWTPRTNFKSWKEISNEKITWKMGSRGNVFHYLYFEWGSKKEELLIGDFDLSKDKIGEMLFQYRQNYRVRMKKK